MHKYTEVVGGEGEPVLVQVLVVVEPNALGNGATTQGAVQHGVAAHLAAADMAAQQEDHLRLKQRRKVRQRTGSPWRYRLIQNQDITQDFTQAETGLVK